MTNNIKQIVSAELAIPTTMFHTHNILGDCFKTVHNGYKKPI